MENRAAIQESLEQRILHGLLCEWEHALCVVDKKISKLMRIPIFCLKEMQKQLGCWSSDKREISLNRSFVLNYSWDNVREVLHHEMAHQMTEEVFLKRDETPHGEIFQQSCRILKANPKASGNYKPLHDHLNDEILDDNDKILIRVKKLMALAESKNTHEAELAITKARMLILKHNLELINDNKERDFISIFLGKPSLHHFREDYSLANILNDFYFVHCIWISSYSIEKSKMCRVLEISGTIKNIKIASYVNDFIRHYINSKWDMYNSKKNLNRYRKTDFAVGVIKGFREKLMSANNKEQIDGKKLELIEVEDHQLKSYVKYKYPRTREVSRGISSQDKKVISDGIKEGKKLVISKGITDEKEVFLIE